MDNNKQQLELTARPEKSHFRPGLMIEKREDGFFYVVHTGHNSGDDKVLASFSGFKDLITYLYHNCAKMPLEITGSVHNQNGY